MHLIPRSLSARAQVVACAVAVSVALSVAPAVVSTAGAVQAASGVKSADCSSAETALTQAQRQQAVAKHKVVKAKKAVKKAKKATSHRAAKVKKAKKVLAKARARYDAATKAVSYRKDRARYACASPTSSTKAEGIGKKISLLGLGNGLDLGTLDQTGLTALLEQLLPGVTDNLSPAQLAALLAGFNGGTDLDPVDALALLTGVLSPDAITDLLGGEASPDAIADLIEDVIGQLSGLAGDFPIPTDFDPTGLWDTFAGIFGTLSADQLGSLLTLLTSAFGGAGESFDVDQLTDLIDALVPGISESFDEDQLAAMLGGLNSDGIGAETLANLLGGRFSPAQLQQVMAGTAGQALLGSVITQVMAQLGTAGAGGLELPGPLGAGQVASLISTVTSLVTGLVGGGEVLPVVCGLIPIPVLCL
ncbi:hypothetical protein ABIE44_002189 [Marmoricola sp. OAE513]|uniref:hypothetical protein n=1 Tax=Marmoricola sp. OAE513 TaxID=2817894 RepID=UPI001AEB4630